MAKISGPLLSVAAHGSINKILNFSKKRTGQQVRKYNKPTVPPTGVQRGQRRLTEFLVAQWQNMSAGDKATWETNARASGLNLSGYHYFLRTAQRDLYTHHGLCGYWSCNKIVAGTIADISGQANTGELRPSYPSNAPVPVVSKAVKFSNALYYDGVDDYVRCGTKAVLDFGANVDFSFEFLAQISTAVATEPQVFGKKRTNATNRPGWGMFMKAGRIRFRISDGVNGVFRDSGFTVEDEIYRWYTVTADRDGNAQLYINGVANGAPLAIASVGNINSTYELTFMIYSGQGAGRAKGIFDEICLYNRLLSAAEIATRYKFVS